MKFASSVRGVMIGCGTSVPSSDQVPELRNARPPNAGTDATAEPVSWHAGATTGVPSRRAATDPFRPPSTVPGSTSAGSRRVGTSSSRSSASAQFRVRASTICVVVADVYSARSTPVSQ